MTAIIAYLVACDILIRCVEWLCHEPEGTENKA